MSPEFVEQFAPQLKLGPRATPMVQAGLDDPNQGVTTDGTPRPYMQEGGMREYFGDKVEQPYDEVPPNFGPEPGLVPPQGDDLRGRLSPDSSNAAPQNILQQPYNGPRATARIPPMEQPRNTARIPPDPQRYTGPRATASIPPDPRGLENRVIEGVRSGDVNLASEERAMSHALNQSGNLAELLSRFNFRIPQRSDGLRGRSDENVLDNPTDYPESDTRVNRVGQTFGDAPDFSTPQGLADFNRRMGTQFGRQSRTQAEQDRLYNRGLTPTRNSAHIGGRALDWPASQLGGLTRREAEEYVRDQWIARGYSPNYTFEWESGHGRNQGSGPHVHVEPK